ncbi:Hypothetical protein PSEBR_m898 [Pseudomonas brassicacearum subsp. brassicacearum NFM421]|uniref:Uncharacterized protein n=1 Tax=Pseudomonas brassicacearum (strain NFM421) TaxID=994484 RepID=F2KG04_PSEBN|nr:Hypothetical protein PSEBR_m898 [Pseudomonas brassicacearum subsp. brassicacearum NFM421]
MWQQSLLAMQAPRFMKDRIDSIAGSLAPTEVGVLRSTTDLFIDPLQGYWAGSE